MSYDLLAAGRGIAAAHVRQRDVHTRRHTIRQIQMMSGRESKKYTRGGAQAGKEWVRVLKESLVASSTSGGRLRTAFGSDFALWCTRPTITQRQMINHRLFD